MQTQGFVAYYRVSTQKQGASGLGLDAQRDAVERYVVTAGGFLRDELTETETGKGASPLARRPQLRSALDVCRRTGATLIIAKLDRLARNVHFVSGLMESRVRFIACDMPEANELTIHIMAAFAEHEAKRISERTRDALLAAKRRGTKLGVTGPVNLKQDLIKRKVEADTFAAKLGSTLLALRDAGKSQRAIAGELNRLGIKTPRGSNWSLIQVQRTLKRLSAL